MARTRKTTRTPGARGTGPAPRLRPAALLRRLVRWTMVALVLLAALVALFGQVNPPPGIHMVNERLRLGAITRDWVPMERISPHMARAAVAAEDANFCLHWGFDMAEIRRAMDAGGRRGASTISQQTVKNVFLWPARSWLRKAMEAVLTPVMEATWSKRRILEVYLNVAEFDAGVFGVEAAARHYFNVSAADLSLAQASRLAAILPDPRGRDAARPSAFVQRRAGAIADGAATIARDGRAACFGG
ncbi:monofunctional biosynthetic peptidoglycan transglycosylase [Rhodobaculum claviforme]|uniref:Biosynthetic peptidoglycan transglycosylase n=1 Tax=Rhodobaculum claviforme TaxID=1549854 RepID=A0A934TLG0_9RHOB|nr:monofunctional biosynthetic peptidoglycan transglycosylase [Rhodobaculum claviforme]MBK5927788.1 monofunctional biosynthetic peptidoglycan transglycosylase [Rhodobaculum claviforme]